MVTQHVTENDPAFSWVGRAVQEFNGGIPSQWRIKMSLAAKSGAKAVDFGNSAFTPGTNNWASLGTQAAQVASALYGRRDSWNVVSVDGGANDADFSSTLAQFYFGDPLAVPPWGVTTLTPATHCPDTDSVYGNAVANRSDIRDALQGIADMAEAKSPSTHVLSVGYPYVLNNTNDCHNDDGGWKGEASVISELNSNATSVNGSNVQYLSLASLFGSTPVSSGYIQLTRYYGYPHPSDGPTSGVDEIGDAAAALAYGSGWQQPLVAPRIFLRGHLSIETKDTKKPPEGGSVVIKW
jgi:hypothetical protein